MVIVRIFCSLILLFVLFSACKKEGCTDSEANNFNQDAEKDDGSCAFDATGLIWYDSLIRDTVLGLGHQELKFFIDGQLIREMDPQDFWNVAPECFSDSTISFLVTLENEKTGIAHLTVLDQWPRIVWSVDIPVNNRSCSFYQLSAADMQ